MSKRPGKELEIQLGIIQKFWLRLLTNRNEIVNAEDIQLGDSLLDHRLLIHSNQPEAARDFLTYPYVHQQIEKLNFLFSRMEFHQGLMRCQYSGSTVEAFTSETLEDILEAMVRIAHSYETRSAEFSLMVVPVQELCPYCRSSLQIAEEMVVACRDCNTKIHDACWQQNGQCTTYGCACVQTAAN